jgi:hypothetical protein
MGAIIDFVICGTDATYRKAHQLISAAITRRGCSCFISCWASRCSLSLVVLSYLPSGSRRQMVTIRIARDRRTDGCSSFPLPYHSRTVSLELQGDPRGAEEDIPGRNDGVALQDLQRAPRICGD